MKKDYRAIARALFDVAPGFLTPAERCTMPASRTPMFDQWEKDVAAIADVLAADSPRFDRERFVRACETGEMGR